MAATTAPAIIVPLCVLLLQLTLCWTINAFRPSSVRRTPMNEQSRKSRQEATAPSSASSQISRLVSSSSSLLESSSKSETVDLQSIDSILSSACPYAAIIFDIDGTLCDSWKLGYDATQTVLQNNNIPLTTPERYHQYTRYATPDRFARHVMDARSYVEVGDSTSSSRNFDDDHDGINCDLLGKQLGLEFDELYIGMVSTTTAGFFPGTLELLKKIASSSTIRGKNIQLGALTNASVAYAYAVFRVNLESEDYEVDGQKKQLPSSNAIPPHQHLLRFRSIHGADTVPRPKPEPDGLLLVCKELGVDPNEAVYIGDSPSDAVAASSAGMKSIGCTWGSHPRENLEKAPFCKLCDTLDELTNELGL